MDTKYIKAVDELAIVARQCKASSDPYHMRKDDLHRLGKSVLKKFAKEIGATEFEVSSNKGGFAVAGEITLHTPQVYIQIVGSSGLSHDLMWRSCRGMKDYTGGPNQWGSVKDLADPTFIYRIARLIGAMDQAA